MHTMWKGSISFGLVHIPIKLYAATETKDVHFRSLHDECQSPIRYQKYCPTCEREVENSEIIKGYEYEPGQFVKISEDEIKEIKGDVGRSVEILDFIDLSEIDPIYYNKSYFIGPNENGEKAYGLLKQAMEETHKIGLAKLTLHSKSHLAVVRGYQNGLLLETIFYPDEVRQIEHVPGLNQIAEVNQKELETAKNLINQLTAEFEPEKYTDDYREAVEDLIQAKIAGNDITHTEKAPERKNVVDLLSALEASIQTTKPIQKQATTEKQKKTPKTSLKKKKTGSG
ncbi:DNA end-binding protein Ku [Pullulanibacillus pueri]|uniref:Non-homologous end joining protein Ku n=1 Tax=Pullulanibacillus pueri TaxID=1437324 RepID=A0A8J2ZZG1_9BACL|nr:Ku protein [Pullulanibacillus pueri]MBM7680559.1 DNA end-binding protein Ku [Pullulanibacillus pueri]GGH88427.1 non-homologous end joining protein Ku [Pullulanibacillus pueri]